MTHRARSATAGSDERSVRATFRYASAFATYPGLLPHAVSATDRMDLGLLFFFDSSLSL